MNDRFDIQGAVTRVMYQPADYLHSSRLFGGLPAAAQSASYRRMQNAAIMDHYRLPREKDFDLLSPLVIPLMRHWPQLPAASRYLDIFIRRAYSLPDDTVPDLSQQAFLSLISVLPMPAWPQVQALPDIPAALSGQIAMTQLLSGFSPALAARFQLMTDASLSPADIRLPHLPDSLLPLVLHYVPFTA
ncbi:hypothetical protein WKC58_01420 [Morganella morganii]|uniref:hypothetical protein n=1 Tax=Morganella morganii TaxID=582 RepID=UPI0007875FC2|nr:hypothetical protein [Morganella morganii]EKU4003988.1 hypothetical protein [Morganella morganii]EKV4234928.1 hypothetical protein [Morganella morganii]ELL8928051.1 hypothetical protein [Morganella morganii]ELY4880221.1 hypothetical protein [Morganella morganii]MBC6659836.1 hypothetical protein [Morganella morganii]